MLLLQSLKKITLHHTSTTHTITGLLRLDHILLFMVSILAYMPIIWYFLSWQITLFTFLLANLLGSIRHFKFTTTSTHITLEKYIIGFIPYYRLQIPLAQISIGQGYCSPKFRLDISYTDTWESDELDLHFLSHNPSESLTFLTYDDAQTFAYIKESIRVFKDNQNRCEEL